METIKKSEESKWTTIARTMACCSSQAEEEVGFENDCGNLDQDQDQDVDDDEEEDEDVRLLHNDPRKKLFLLKRSSQNDPHINNPPKNYPCQKLSSQKIILAKNDPCKK